MMPGSERNNMKKSRKKKIIPAVIILAVLILVLAVIIFAMQRNRGISDDFSWDSYRGGELERPELDVQLLTPNEYSRPQIALNQINGIVIHYTANPGASAQDNRNYFENLQNGSSGTHASSHFIVGLDGEIIQCIPSTEISYASNDRNTDTLAIECCHPDETGEFTDETYDSLVYLTAWLCLNFDVDPDQVIRHYDITGKDCPKYFVEHEDAWERFIADVKSTIEGA